MIINDILKTYLKKGLNKLNLLKDEHVQIANKRYEICTKCPLFNLNTCDSRKKTLNEKTNKYVFGCGCKLSVKVFCLDCKCPANKWDNVKADTKIDLD